MKSNKFLVLIWKSSVYRFSYVHIVQEKHTFEYSSFLLVSFFNPCIPKELRQSIVTGCQVEKYRNSNNMNTQLSAMKLYFLHFYDMTSAQNLVNRDIFAGSVRVPNDGQVYGSYSSFSRRCIMVRARF